MALQSHIWSLLCPAAAAAARGTGRERAPISHNFPLFSLSSLPSQQHEEMKKKEGNQREGREGPPILSRLFLPLSRSLQTEQPAAAAASGAGSIHLERGKVDAMGDAAHAAAMLETV